MRRLLGLGAAVFVAAAALSTAAGAADRQYDCTKAGNANKAACKGAAKAAPAATPAKAKPEKATKAAAAALAAKTTTTTKTAAADAAKPAERNYDCSKAGNKNKAACKGVATAAAAPAPAAAAKPAATTTTTTTAAKPSGLATAAKSIFAPKPAAAPAAATTTTTMANAPAGPAKASATMAANAGPPQAGKPTATCRDGTPSMSQHRSGTCAGHGGVATWLAQLP